jgi:predicted CoA-binding protein
MGEMGDDVRAVLTGTRVWAVVGCSPDPRRDSHRIAALLQREGYRVIPVNPAVDELLGERCYPSLGAIPEAVGVEVVDVFRRSSAAGAHVDEAIAIGARAVWLQLGVIDEAGRGAGARGRPARGDGPLPGDRAAAAAPKP